MLATPLCILLTLLAAAPTGQPATPSALDAAVASADAKKTAKNAPVKRATARKATASKATSKTAASKKATSSKAASKKTTARKATAKRATAKATARKATRATTSAASKSRAARATAPARKHPPTKEGTVASADLRRARALLKAVKEDPHRRRYRDEWEKAIRALILAAKGRDRAPAMLEAARARYALYRFSSDEADRDRALLNARRARAAGARDADTLIAAIRREAGDDEPPRAVASSRSRPHPEAAPPRKAHPVAKPLDERGGAPRPVPPAADGAVEADEPPDTDPVLDRILAQLAEDPEDAHVDPAHDAADGAPNGRESSPEPSAHEVERERVAPPAPERAPTQSDRDALAAVIGGLSRPEPAAPREELRGPIRKIVLDPGHGGHDPGAIGPSRVREKDVVLAIAKRLASKLRAEGYEVVLTRDDDRYLALAERTAFANAHQGDLFVSLHANAHPRRDRTGVETWVLDVNSDRYSRRLAARENGMIDEVDGPLDVRRILADLDAKMSVQASRRLAGVVQQELTSGIRQRFGPVKDLGVKSALFYVLLGARMPAVLVETSFISNRTEEKRLASNKFQDEVASALVRAIDTFAAQQSRIAAR